jgi:hypothetical protein
MNGPAREVSAALGLGLGVVLTLVGLVSGWASLLVAGFVVVGIGIVRAIVVVIFRPDGGSQHPGRRGS